MDDEYALLQAYQHEEQPLYATPAVGRGYTKMPAEFFFECYCKSLRC